MMSCALVPPAVRVSCSEKASAKRFCQLTTVKSPSDQTEGRPTERVIQARQRASATLLKWTDAIPYLSPRRCVMLSAQVPWAVARCDDPAQSRPPNSNLCICAQHIVPGTGTAALALTRNFRDSSTAHFTGRGGHGIEPSYTSDLFVMLRNSDRTSAGGWNGCGRSAALAGLRWGVFVVGAKVSAAGHRTRYAESLMLACGFACTVSTFIHTSQNQMIDIMTY